ncbi:hypothetical protein MTP04_09020 [Lysinibacillus sp. PLM2]|nr:hypothetical protein MTP04_09020 [Lysinibacillus sp. PLM2]
MQIFQKLLYIVSISLFGIFIYLSEDNLEANAEEFDFTSKELRLAAKQYLDSPYLYGGTTESGFDCSGFVNRVFLDLGIELPRTSVGLFKEGESISRDELQTGDLVFFNTSGQGVSHVGIYYGGGKFIHSQSVLGVSISNLNDKWYWGTRYIGAKRIADVKLAYNTNGKLIE